ncbi:Transcriptional regulator, contains XRE-family HTH domain [Thermoactinomyces sp. DSM 45891]|uniref:helix-turn-helix domain-containing protein n=1 Tax=Thermoactinomyces sp. DSM 45891 TaxID=1761907 RepID=UPI00091714A1|nr:helix-turn-helix transcriptional regulator [Thermoactinomyces sp. DSM 45891]SFX65963.1 Transcriptional regulator, contains XRE-family HTH domain [Thermoactinomyces sp. DSM 45891]
MRYHYGITIREGRESLKMTQSQLASLWPQTGDRIGVSVNYVSDIERGIKNITDVKTLRCLCGILHIPPWKMGLSDYDPFNPQQITHSGYNHYGIIKVTDSPIDRILDYKNCLLEAKGECFISGTSMIHIAEDSSDILKEKLYIGNVHLLLLDPDWIETNYSILTFMSDEEDRQSFHYEIRNSIRKLNQLRKSLPQDIAPRLKIKTYSTIFPYIMTGFDNGDTGKLVVEILDYVPEKRCPRFTLNKNNDRNSLFEQVKDKFLSMWHNEFIVKEI